MGDRSAAKRPATADGGGSWPYVRRHLRFGWWSLLLYLGLGLVLEALHGFKVGWYLDVANETRRLMWTLGHAHGTLFSLVNLALAGTIWLVPSWSGQSRSVASWWLIAATVLMPVGFVLGGAVIYAGDPGVPVVLVAASGLMLLFAILLTAVGMGAGLREAPPGSPPSAATAGSGSVAKAADEHRRINERQRSRRPRSPR